MGVLCQSLTGADLPRNSPVMAATVFTITALVLLLVFPSSPSPLLRKRAADSMSLAEGNAEPISAMNGFYGNSLYRPYGFSSWGVGSSGYMRNSIVVTGPHICIEYTCACTCSRARAREALMRTKL